ncbi:MAG: hypothetical protein M1833_005491 [Piccolia ochrophora]|nr:MAG: hypothetical protein M1833_005491 [Piccolia ochrophora]
MPAPGCLYKWEDTAALAWIDHKCGTCHTPLSSQKAKTTCIGSHEVVCRKYHKTLFFVGSSHKCEACRTSLEQHEKRHREVATLIKRIHDLDQAATERDGDPSIVETNLKDDDGSESTAKDGRGAENSCEHSKEPTMKDSSPTDDPRLNGRRARKAAKKAAKLVARIKTSNLDILTQIQEALHPRCELFEAPDQVHDSTGELIDKNVIDAHIIFNPRVFSWRAKHNKFASRSLSGSLENLDAKAAAEHTLLKLGVVPEVPRGTRQRKDLICKLCEAIKDDLTAVENEEKETRMRMEGYWRYVNRKVYDRMVANNRQWDWESGEKVVNEMLHSAGEESEQDANGLPLNFNNSTSNEVREDGHNKGRKQENEAGLAKAADLPDHLRLASVSPLTQTSPAKRASLRPRRGTMPFHFVIPSVGEARRSQSLSVRGRKPSPFSTPNRFAPLCEAEGASDDDESEYTNHFKPQIARQGRMIQFVKNALSP